MGCYHVPFRFWIGVMIFFGSYIAYTTRANLSMSITAMVKKKEETIVAECGERPNETNAIDSDDDSLYDWDEVTQGNILAAVYWGYFFGSFFSGMMSEWLGAFWTIFITTFTNCVFNSICVWAVDLHVWALIVCRFIMGTTSAFLYPAMHVLIAEWSPPREKGKFAAAMMGNTLGVVFSWYVVAVVNENFGWKWGFHVITAQAAVYIVIYCILCSDSPDKNYWTSEAEAAYILEQQKALGEQVNRMKVVPPYWSMMKSVPFWAFILSHFANVWGLFLQLNEVPKFLIEVLGLPSKDSGILGAIPQILRLIIGLFFGWLGDYVVQTEKMTVAQVRKGFTIISHILPGILIGCVWLAGCDAIIVVVLLTASLGLNGAGTVTYLLNNQDLSPNFAGSIFSLAILTGALGGFIAPLITGVLIKNHNGIQEWGINFLLAGIIYIVGGGFFMIWGSVEIQPWNMKERARSLASLSAGRLPRL